MIMKLFGLYNKHKNKHSLILLILILSPVVWSLLFQPISVISEVVKAPQYIKTNISSIFASSNLRHVEEMRWNAFGEEKNELLSTIFYNKVGVLFNKFFDLFSMLSPRLFFQSGDGTQFSPTGIEPVASVLIIFWFLGIYQLLKQKKYKTLYLIPVAALPAFVAGQRNIVFLFPLLILYLHIVIVGMRDSLKKIKSKNRVIVILLIYGLFIIGRWLLL